MRVTVLDDYQGVVARLDAAKELGGDPLHLRVITERIADEGMLIDALRDADCVILIRERTRLTARIIEALPALRLIVQTGRLAGCIDLEACRRRGIEVREGSASHATARELFHDGSDLSTRSRGAFPDLLVTLPSARRLDRKRVHRAVREDRGGDAPCRGIEAFSTQDQLHCFIRLAAA